MSASQYQVPGTPQVISATPTPSESGSIKDGYFGPTTRSLARSSRVNSPSVISEDEVDPSTDPEARARSRSRSPHLNKRHKIAPLTASTPKPTSASTATPSKTKTVVKEKPKKSQPLSSNGHLAPPPRSYWRELSRSPSPLGLIPIHERFRLFVHRHEIPRKALHVSIGFLTTYLYTQGYQMSDVHPILLILLVPIATTDVLRHRWDAFNRFYIKCLGAMMRESEVDGYNGVIWYLLGAWIVLRFCPKDVGTVSVLLLSWCDTAASTFGRLYGKYTPKVRRGKSLAGSLAALLCGVGTAIFWWGYVAPLYGKPSWNTGVHAFAFQGRLTLPAQVNWLLGWTAEQPSITGPIALGVLSVWTGFVASASEAVGLFGWDDNLTIPVLCGVGLWGFLKVFT